LTNPNDFLPGSGPLSQPAPLFGPGVQPEDNSAPEPSAANTPDTASLIDSVVAAISYLWLCCGAVLILVAVLVFVWLMRRTRRA
jgi:hypothetical protein